MEAVKTETMEEAQDAGGCLGTIFGGFNVATRLLMPHISGGEEIFMKQEDIKMAMTNGTYALQDSFNNYLEEQVAEKLSTLIPQGFRALQHPSGFNYMTNDGLSYNLLTLQCMDSLYAVDKKTNFPYIKSDRFSTLCYNVLQSARYTLSQASEKKVNDCLIKYQGQAATVIKEYQRTGLPKLTSTEQAAAIHEIYANCFVAFKGEVDMDCSIIPDSYLTFKVALQELNNMAGDAAQLVMLVGNKNGLLKSTVKNIGTPTKENAGLPTSNSQTPYYVGYDKIPDPNSLIGSLNDSGNSLTISISGESYNSNEVILHMENKSPFVIPILSLLSIEVNHKSTFDMDNLKTASMKFSTEITYSGLTPLGIEPTALSATGTTGWFAETTILKELKAKTGKDVDGFKLTDTRYTIASLFGKELAYLKAMLLSKVPTIKITFTHINMEYAHSCFTTEDSVDIKLFGFIDLGGHVNSYKTENVSFNEAEQSVTITFAAPAASGTLPAELQTAYIMGGVPYYPGMN